MPDRQLPARPNLEQYKKQARELANACDAQDPEARERVRRHHPRFSHTGAEQIRVGLTDAQLVIAREHGFPSWPKFAAHITTLNLERSVAELDDPVAAFIRAACVPRNDSHSSGTLEGAQLILARHPQVHRANIHVAAILADESGVRAFITQDRASATAKGGPEGWDPLTHLCFSRYLRLDRERSDAFVRTARALLDAGASANTGWIEMIDHPNPRPILESAIYGAAGIAHHADLTRLLLEYGADPNDEETAYHAAEGYDLAAMKVLVESGKLNGTGLTTLLVRKADWHDTEGIRWLLEHGSDPNHMAHWSHNALQHAVRRDNQLATIALFLDHGADPSLASKENGRSATAIAARRGRGDVLRLLEERGFDPGFEGPERLIAACAVADDSAIRELVTAEPQLVTELIAQGGTLLVEFAGNGNREGVRRLLDLGVPAVALHGKGDIYWDVTKESTALHNAAWRASPSTLKLLIERGAPVNALDGKGRTALALAIRACVDSYWKDRRTPESVEALLNAGAITNGIEIPCGYDAVDALLLSAKKSQYLRGPNAGPVL
jgi:ankyrin repeat protein